MKEYQYTKEEINDLIERLKDVFLDVRLLDASQVDEENAYDRNISSEVLENKKDSSKLEVIDGKCFQIIAKYVEVEDKPYSLEFVTEIGEKNLVDSRGYKLLVQKYDEKIQRYYRDDLTKVGNRFFYEETEQMNRRNAGIAMIDVDYLGDINEEYGQRAGDLALQTVAKIILEQIRSDDKVIRFGDDEFLMILEGINESNFELKLESIRQAIREAEVPGCSRLQLSVSIGALISDGRSRDACAMKAERLMYLAKSSKNRVVTEWNRENDLMAKIDAEIEKPRVLIVDDVESNRMILEAFLENDFQVMTAENGKVALNIMDRYQKELSVVLLDIIMPEMDGYEVLKNMAENQWLQELPVIVISGESDDGTIIKCFEMGASDYIRKPFANEIVLKRVKNVTRLYQRQKQLQKEIHQQIEERERNSRILTGILSHVVECRNGESGPHVQHVERITELLLNRLEEITDLYPMSEEAKSQISSASALHDIGKMGIDEKILNKPGRLTDEEFEIMKTHTIIGAHMVEQLGEYKNEPLVRYTHEICRWHHEKWDGKGYPDGLKGDDIPISAQVVSVADVYDALVSDRVYKAAYSHEKALDMILHGECGQFNPILIECLVDCHKHIIRIYTGGGRLNKKSGFSY